MSNTATDLEEFFASRNMPELYERGKDVKSDYINPTPDDVIKPNLIDLHSLYSLCEKTSRTTILEFGCGWSSYLFAAYMAQFKKEIGSFEGFRRNAGFECHTLDNYPRYIDIARKRIPEHLQSFITFHYSAIQMREWNGRIATEYVDLPLVNPDFIYLDGPDQNGTRGDVNGISTRHDDFMPMVCDILKIEHFLMPKTIIVVDGRAANARFMKCNLQRNWDYKYCPDRDQHFFVLEEDSLGKHSQKLIEEMYYRKGKWTIKDL